VRLYADTARLRFRQLATDLAVLGWVAIWAMAGLFTHRIVLRIAAPARALEGAGDELASSLDEAARRTESLPLLGGALAGPLDAAGAAASRLAAAGVAGQEATERLAVLLGLVVALAPALTVLARWLPGRVRWVREAAAARALVLRSDDLELFALRALVSRPLTELRAVDPAPGAAFARGDRTVIAALAARELEALGQRPPQERRSSS
jgi:hypothetical protein